MKFVFHPDAEAELNAAIEYYEKIEIGLGYDFAVEIYTLIQVIISFPKIW